ncbi:B93 [miniopterid betaherpesvirus 1]|uniref:B93 n=1 Tax=miniopterid betaherpesvirus 1 TaxID=3070189 RepID=I3VQ86_9BETA|nr:B93 [miniopterid betaherpesvirus 1]AFK83930.1 B93 [miniopterid betaherpesvirus 1]
METHLSSDLDFEQRYAEHKHVPIHLVLGDEALSYFDHFHISRIYYRTLGDKDLGWERARFTVVSKEIVLEKYIHETARRVLRRPVKDFVCPEGGKKPVKMRFAVFTTIGVRCENDAIVSTDVIRLRVVCVPRDPFKKYSGYLTSFVQAHVAREEPSFDGTESVVDIDIVQKDIFATRVKFSQVATGSRPSPAPRERLTESGALGSSADMPDADSADVSTRFFSISSPGRMSPSIESYLSRFMGCVNEDVRSGPLEDPSKVRGCPVTTRRGRLLPDIVDADTVEGAYAPSKTDAWFGEDNKVFVVGVHDIKRLVKVHVVWYERSFWATNPVRCRNDDRSSMRDSLAKSFGNFLECLASLCENVCVGLESSLGASNVLSQKFSCAIASSIDFNPVLDLLCVSKDVWVNKVSERSCIIKALVERLRDADHGDDVRYLGRGAPYADCWADVIDCVRNKVYPGINVQLKASTRTGLLFSQHRDGRDTAWVRDPRLCVLYVDRNLHALWVVPGGFCVEFDVPFDGVQLNAIRDRFKMR